MPARPLLPVPVPPGPAGVSAVLAALPGALDGRGPAVAPLVPAGSAAGSGTGSASDRAAAAVLLGGAPLESDAVAAVLATSGSTGDPKGVLLPGAALLASARASLARLGPAAPAGWLAALPVTGAGGFGVLVRAVVAGGPVVALRTLGGAGAFGADGFAEDAAVLAEVLGGAPAGVSLVPAQLARLLDDPAGTDALAGFAAVLLGGAAAPPGLLDRARAAGVAVVTTYGMTETCGGCVYDGAPLDGVRVSLGRGAAGGAGAEGGAAAPGASGEVADGRGPGMRGPGTAEPPGPAGGGGEPGQAGAPTRGAAPEAGEPVRVGGATVAAGYRGRPGETRRRFVGGEFLTDDLGRWDSGRLLVVGRRDDVVQVAGASVAVGAVEAEVARAPGVAQAAVVAVADPARGARLVAYVVLAGQGHGPRGAGEPGAGSRDAVPVGEAVGAVVRGRLGRAAVPEVVVVPELPLLPGGKVDRALLRERAG